MYGLPEKIDLNFLKGKSLLQVCIGQNEIILHFEDDESDSVSITIQSYIEVNSDIKEIEKFENIIEAGRACCESLGQKITTIYPQTNGTLKLEFDSKNFIIIYDDSKKYESYSIKYKNGLVVV
jgi:hypothetical protein